MCEHKEYELRERSPHIGKYCKACGKWLGWMKQRIDTGEVASEKQQSYAIALIEQWKRSGCPMTAGQAGAIISTFGTKQ